MFDRFVGVPNLQPLSEKDQAELDAFFKHMKEKVVPQIVEDVRRRERNAVEARKIFIS